MSGVFFFETQCTYCRISLFYFTATILCTNTKTFKVCVDWQKYYRYIPLNTQLVILEISLSRQLIALVLTTENKETKHYIHQKHKRQTQNYLP